MQENNLSTNNFEQCLKCNICTTVCPMAAVNSHYPGPKQAGPDLGLQSINVKYADAEGVRIQLTKVKEQWPELKAKYRSQVYTFEKMQRLFRIVGAPADPAEIGLSREKLKAMVPFTQLMRYRINLLDLAKRGMFYDGLVEAVFGPNGAWNTAAELI